MKAKIDVNKDRIDISVPLVFWQEGDYTVAYCPPLELAAQGINQEDAKSSFTESVKLFFNHIRQNGTLHSILIESGFKKTDGKHPQWQAPTISGFTQNQVAV